MLNVCRSIPNIGRATCFVSCGARVDYLLHEPHPQNGTAVVDSLATNCRERYSDLWTQWSDYRNSSMYSCLEILLKANIPAPCQVVRCRTVVKCHANAQNLSLSRRVR